MYKMANGKILKTRMHHEAHLLTDWASPNSIAVPH